MKMINSSRLTRSAGAFVALAALGLAGCDTDRLLEVNDTDLLPPEAVADPDLVSVAVTGAIGEFTIAYSGSGGDAFVSVSALMSDELFSSGTFTTRTATDRREQFAAQNGNTSDGTYVNLQQARVALKNAAADAAAAGVSDATVARLIALEGYTYVTFAEGYCSSIPISEYDFATGEFTFGSASTTAGLLTDAVALFDQAIALGSDLAAVGKGRALVNAGDYAGAAAAVAGVADGYAYFVDHSINGASNPIWSLQGNGRYSQSDAEGTNGVAFRSSDDTRTQWFDDGGGFDAGIPLYVSERYPDETSPVLLASGVEARLIEAEAALNSGAATALDDMTTILNDLRQNVHTLMGGIVDGYEAGDDLTDLAVPATFEEGRDILFEERAYWLYLTGHRLGDLRRLVRDYGVAQDAAYPTGAYHKGGAYGSDVVFEIDFDENNNPNYDVSSCNVLSVN